MEYTKGEWSVIEGSKPKCGLHVIRTLPNDAVDRICEIVLPSTGYRAEAEANANLIAAAPELLEALKEITELAPRDKLKLPYAIQVVEIADRAIAEVEGK